MKESFWSPAPPTPDSYVLFRGHFRLDAPACVEFRVVGSSWYQAWLDDRPLLEGPLRFALDRPEYQSTSLDLPAGDHLLAFHAHHLGVETRLLKETPPFLWCEILAGQARVPVEWWCLPLESPAARTHRINPQLGWIEWRDTRLEPEGWEKRGFPDAAWIRPSLHASTLPEPVAADLGTVQTFPLSLQPLAEGPLANTFGYPIDEPSYVFHIRDRVCRELPAKGIWRRYDLGRVRLGRPCLRLDVPAGTVIEMALAEYLTEGRVSPYINLSAGTSCNLDRFIARGGEQVFCPLTPKGGRFCEVHVVNAREGVRFLEEKFLERGYHPPTGATFSCGDPLLEKVWSVGVETYRACAEDAIIDNPTRERGQWIGDVASVGLEIASIAYHDLRLCRRALVQSALCPREDGLVAGMAPGGCCYLPTYAFQWTVAVLHYFRHTGDRRLLEELWEAARRNMEGIRAFWQTDGLHAVAGWNFVDWGYRTEEGPVDTAANLHYLWSLRCMVAWAQALGRDASPWEAQAGELSALLQDRITAKRKAGGWDQVGFHCTTLAMRLGLVSEEEAGLDFIARHWNRCFPNDPSAPRNDDPFGFEARLITPYFAHYVMPLFIERGRMDFVLEQFRRCWGGYMLADGRTTWIEVFDTRWSHCHQWSGCPTWQLSRYLLGLHPRFDLGAAHYDFRLEPGSLPRAAGRLPHPQGGWIDVSWQREQAGIRCRVSTPAPMQLRFPDGRTLTVQREADFPVPDRQTTGR